MITNITPQKQTIEVLSAQKESTEIGIVLNPQTDSIDLKADSIEIKPQVTTQTIAVSTQNEQTISFMLATDKPKINLTLGVTKEITTIENEYEGPYVVTPKVTSQNLPTKNKAMSDDVHIKAIPYYEVSNSFNGHTVYIGGDMNG